MRHLLCRRLALNLSRTASSRICSRRLVDDVVFNHLLDTPVPRSIQVVVVVVLASDDGRSMKRMQGRVGTGGRLSILLRSTGQGGSFAFAHSLSTCCGEGAGRFGSAFAAGLRLR